MSILCREDTHVNSVQIFKFHDDHHHEYIQGQFLFQVTDYIKTNRKMTPLKRSMLAPVPIGTSPSNLLSRTGIFRLVHHSVLDTKSFAASNVLAEKITAKIMSRFRFITTSCSNIIIAVNVDRIYTDFDLELDQYGAVSSSFRLFISENDQEDMDDDDDNEDYDHDNDDNNICCEFEEDFFSDIKGFSEVTGLVDVKPHEVLNYMDCCSICLEEYGSDSSRVAKAEASLCSHIFHRDCIHPWLRKFSNCCPLCRSVFIAQV